jgi:hypothetical protein
MRYSGINIFGFTGEDPTKELYGFTQEDVEKVDYNNFAKLAKKNYDTVVTGYNYQYAIKEGPDIGHEYEDHFTERDTGKPMYQAQILFNEYHPFYNIVDLNDYERAPAVDGELAIKWQKAMLQAVAYFMKDKLP